ncbi:MAG: hypothetical protein P8046_10095, partial [Anaerolineales bacterium]
MKYSPEVEQEIQRLSAKIEEDEVLCGYYQPRWLAIQLLEGGLNTLNGHREPRHALLEALHTSQQRLSQTAGNDPDILLPEQRYAFVQSLVQTSVKRAEENASTFSDKIDRVVANRYLGVPIFLFIMYLMFNIVQNVSAPFLDWIDSFFTIYLAGWVNNLLTLVHAPLWFNSLLIDGVIAGVGGVLVFVPGLFTMYAMLSIMEQSGYM